MLGVYTNLSKTRWPHADNLIDGKVSVVSGKLELYPDWVSGACACKTPRSVSDLVRILHKTEYAGPTDEDQRITILSSLPASTLLHPSIEALRMLEGRQWALNTE